MKFEFDGSVFDRGDVALVETQAGQRRLVRWDEYPNSESDYRYSYFEAGDRMLCALSGHHPTEQDGSGWKCRRCGTYTSA